LKVVCVNGKEDLAINEYERPVCIPGHAIVRMEMCGVCGSDVTAYRGSNPTVKYPIEGIGHEGVGEIVEIMDPDNRFNIGDRVALEPYVPCGECPMCRHGRFNNCESLKVCGVHKNGMMAEYFLHPVSLLHRIPDTLNYRDACLVEPFTIGLHAITRAKVKKDDYCVVFGAGTIGLLAALGIKLYGGRPVLVDVIESRLHFAREVGIEDTINSMNEDVSARLREISGGRLPDVMIECTGSQAVLRNIHEYVAHGANVALVGWPHDLVPFNQVRLMQKEVTIYTSRNSNGKFPESMGYIADGLIPVDRIITSTTDLDGLEDVIKGMIVNPDRYLKVVAKI